MTTKLLLGKIPIIDKLFKRVAVDLVDPIQPALRDRGNRYIFKTLVDFTSRCPETVAMKNTEAGRVGEALVEIF